MKYEQFLINAASALANCHEMKETLSAVQAALSAMPDMVRKNERLEKENGELKAELDDWKGSAEGFQPDGYMKLPLDADGVPIRLGDTVWYIGVDVGIAKDYPLKVDGFVMEPFDFGIFIETQEFQHKAIAPESLTHEQLEPADSWEKLEEDANLGRRDYCEKHHLDECDYNMRMHIVMRAKKLAGIEKEAER